MIPSYDDILGEELTQWDLLPLDLNKEEIKAINHLEAITPQNQTPEYKYFLSVNGFYYLRKNDQ